MDKRLSESESNQQTVTIPKTEYDALQQELKWYKEFLILSQHRQFGSSSEKTSKDQLSMFNEAEANANEGAAEPELKQAIAGYSRKKGKRGIDKLPEDLPVEIVEHTLPAEEQSCPECGNNLHIMGTETRDELKFVPARAVIVRHIVSTYSCRKCEKNNTKVPIIKASAPQPVIKGSFASPQAIAHIAAQKFVMGVPLYRQEQEWKRAGIDLSRQTMSNWLLRASHDCLEPLYDNLRRLLLERSVLHADETTLQVLHEEGKAAQSKSYMWLYRTGGDAKIPQETLSCHKLAIHLMPIVLYDYQPDRRAKRPQVFLKDYKGYLHTDGYEAYHGLSEDIVVVGCWAHARRKFDEALKPISPAQQIGTGAMHGKSVCDKLFSIERSLVDLPPEKRLTKRRELAKPIVDDFLHWLKQQKIGKTLFGNAVHYTLSQWKYLERYLLDGRLEISNNRAERSIKPFVIGRKNWLFANTPKGAKASAILYSIIETAKENDLDPYRYLSYIFSVAPNCDLKNEESVNALLPINAPADCRCKG